MLLVLTCAGAVRDPRREQRARGHVSLAAPTLICHDIGMALTFVVSAGGPACWSPTCCMASTLAACSAPSSSSQVCVMLYVKHVHAHTRVLYLGTNAVNFYAQTVLSEAGFSNNKAFFFSIFIGVIKVCDSQQCCLCMLLLMVAGVLRRHGHDLH